MKKQQHLQDGVGESVNKGSHEDTIEPCQARIGISGYIHTYTCNNMYMYM